MARTTWGQLLPLLRGSFQPILLKKSVLVSMAKKEIEILNRRGDIRTRISRSGVLEGRIH